MNAPKNPTRPPIYIPKEEDILEGENLWGEPRTWRFAANTWNYLATVSHLPASGNRAWVGTSENPIDHLDSKAFTLTGHRDTMFTVARDAKGIPRLFAFDSEEESSSALRSKDRVEHLEHPELGQAEFCYHNQKNLPVWIINTPDGVSDSQEGDDPFGKGGPLKVTRREGSQERTLTYIPGNNRLTPGYSELQPNPSTSGNADRPTI